MRKGEKDMKNETASVVIGSRGTIEVTRVTKTAARKVFDNGGRVLVTTSNMNIQSPWCPVIVLNGDGSDFETIVNATHYYNCSNEAGKYLKYYIEIA